MLKTKVLFILFISTISFTAHAQDSKLNQIKKQVNFIDNNESLTEFEYDWTKISGVALDGGGILKVWKDNNHQIHKIYRELGLSYGRTKTTFYLKDGIPIKIVEIEENFGHANQEINCQELHEVFRVDIYVYDWEMCESKIERKGKRVMTETPCSTFEYEPIMIRAFKAAQ